MGRSNETFSKKEIRNKKEKKRKDKALKKQERKETPRKNSFEEMIAYVDENGMISATPPDPSMRSSVSAESIQLSYKKTDEDRKTRFEGVLAMFDSSRGFGFIQEKDSRERIFVHQNDCEFRLSEGIWLEFDKERSARGLKASKVSLKSKE